MKYFLIFAMFLFASCQTKQPKKQKPFSDTSGVIEALYVTNGSTLALSGGPVKRVISGKDIPVVDSLDDDGKELKKGQYIVKAKFVVDTFYLLPNVDSTLLVLDSAKKPVLDAQGNKQYQQSFAKPVILPKQYLFPTTIYFPQVK